jgi:hypothetical protein
MTIKPSDLDAGAAVGGAAASAWNFIIGGQLNILIGVIVGALSIAVLIQRLVINRRAIREDESN